MEQTIFIVYKDKILCYDKRSSNGAKMHVAFLSLCINPVPLINTKHNIKTSVYHAVEVSSVKKKPQRVGNMIMDH